MRPYLAALFALALIPVTTQPALATWGDITFNYESTDTPDVVATPTTV